MMEFRCRQEIVGKRFLGIKKGLKLKIKECGNWEWQSGVVRALTSREYLDPEVLVSEKTIVNKFYIQVSIFIVIV